jgi:hypothetical protein
MSIRDITNAQTGREFRVRIVKEGEAYGRDMCLIHDKVDPLVEFYDVKHEFDVAPDGAPLGQFVSRYYLSTLMGEGALSGPSIFTEDQGLNLDGGVDVWSIDAIGMADVELFLYEQGLINEMTSKSKYSFGHLAFEAESMIGGSGPIPSICVMGKVGESHQEWARIHSMCNNQMALIAKSREDLGDPGADEDELDVVLPVVITSTGEMRVYHDEPRYLLAAHSAAKIFDANGMNINDYADDLPDPS